MPARHAYPCCAVTHDPASQEALSSDGRRVLEAELADEEPGPWVVRALEVGAAVPWLRTSVT
jgi:hypothetical protein